MPTTHPLFAKAVHLTSFGFSTLWRWFPFKTLRCDDIWIELAVPSWLGSVRALAGRWPHRSFCWAVRWIKCQSDSSAARRFSEHPATLGSTATTSPGNAQRRLLTSHSMGPQHTSLFYQYSAALPPASLWGQQHVQKWIPDFPLGLMAQLHHESTLPSRLEMPGSLH